MLKDYYFSAGDDKFIKEDIIEEKPTTQNKKVLDSYEYVRPSIFPKPNYYNKNAAPISFRTSPDTLLNLAAKVADSIPLPSVFTWTIEDICRWLRRYGYPQYQNTFRVNLINGRSFLLLRASELCEMNIKDFDHICHLTRGIRGLFYFEMTKFGRSITLAPEFHYELYKLLRVKNGTKYEISKCTELWRRMQLIRQRTPGEFKEHWEILERWLSFEPNPKWFEEIGGIRRFKLFKCKPKGEIAESVHGNIVPCECIPPCECFWSERNLRKPRVLTCLPKSQESKSGTETSVLSVLHHTFPDRYREYTVRGSSFLHHARARLSLFQNKIVSDSSLQRQGIIAENDK